jgi:ectoine hydroxylase-related dioxygenase (phytanoyl-CoA dioxygenase family)
MAVSLEKLPPLDSLYSLPADKTEAYQHDGHVCVRAVASKEEVEAYRKAIADLVMKLKAGEKKLEERDTYHKAFLQVGNLWEIDEAVKKFVTARRFGQIAAELMGVDGVRVYHDQGLFKEVGGGHTPWHQDQYYWPFDTDKTITMWMPLVDAPLESGTMVFASGSHKEGSLAQLGISDESAEYFRKLTMERGWPLVINELAAGDATFHSGWTLHKAPGNSAGYVRQVMTVIYYADGSRIAEPTNKAQPVDMERWFPGQKPGDIAATHLNPLVYHKDPSKIGS